MDYDVAQVFCSQIVPKVVLFFAGVAPDDSIDFEPENVQTRCGICKSKSQKVYDKIFCIAIISTV